MDLAGDRPLSCANLTLNQHRDIGAGDLSHETEDVAHGCAASYDVPFRLDPLVTRSGFLFDGRNAGKYHGTVPSTRTSRFEIQRAAPQLNGIDRTPDG
jgi:hypothetical protein